MASNYRRYLNGNFVFLLLGVIDISEKKCLRPNLMSRFTFYLSPKFIITNIKSTIIFTFVNLHLQKINIHRESCLNNLILIYFYFIEYFFKSKNITGQNNKNLYSLKDLSLYKSLRFPE